MSAHPRRARRALAVAGGVFAVGVVVSVWSLPSLVPTFQAAGHGAARSARIAIDVSGNDPTDRRIQATRSSLEPAFTARYEGARDAIATVGWEVGRLPTQPSLDCWSDSVEQGCDLNARSGARAPLPAGGLRIPRMDRLLATTDAALANEGWRCDGTLAARSPKEPASWLVTCATGATTLRVAFWPAPVSDVDVQLREDDRDDVTISLEAFTKVYRSADETT